MHLRQKINTFFDRACHNFSWLGFKMLCDVFEPDELQEDDDAVVIIGKEAHKTNQNEILENNRNELLEDTQEDISTDDEKEACVDFAQIHSPSLPDLHLSIDERTTQYHDSSLQIDSCALNVDSIEDEAFRSGYYWASHSRLDFRTHDAIIKILGHTETFAKTKVLFLIKTSGFDTVCWEDAEKVQKKFPDIVSQYEESEIQYLYIACEKQKNLLNLFVDGNYETSIVNPLLKAIGQQNIPMSDLDLLLSKKKRMTELQDELRTLTSDVFDLAIPMIKKIKI